MSEVKVTRPTDIKNSEFFKTQDCIPQCHCVRIAFKTKKAPEKAKWKDLRKEIKKHIDGMEEEDQVKANFIHILKDHYFLNHGHNVDDF